ncbi:predicted protein [Uncinocarpus reesii 1704]|uniref:BRCT domain-containing protein n=1 Tax=Uncinocarpus reesii (strain UAMH 1704) TaxID=336963 RepID=C4JG83_UNCRE|nr:uncharacterized protein UREG_02481 [Uncinocarpus reesii 1704]EEP77632.1 predicted protein [Uncinocarpus reesii 1704]
MARRAPDIVAPASPPQRVTRARTRTIAGKDNANKEASTPAPASTTATAGPKRGRPRKNIATAEIPSTAAPRTKAATNAVSSQTSGPKRRGPKQKIAQVSDENDSSDDEVDVVTVRTTAKSRSTKASAGPKTAASRTERRAVRSVKGEQEPADDDSDDDDDELAQPEQSKTKAVRSRSATVASVRTSKAPTSGTEIKTGTRRGRKGSAAATVVPARSKQISIPSAMARKPDAAITYTASAKNKASSSAPKKKVTFLDMAENSDKENQPLTTPVADNQKVKAGTGLKAKPVRRPVTPVYHDEEQVPKAQSKKEPLSPKKSNQVIRPSASNSPGDAVDTADRVEIDVTLKTPQTSPIKVPNLRQSLASPAKKIDFGASRRLTAPGSGENCPRAESGDVMSTEKEAFSLKDSTIMSTPARRLPPSPFKDSMKISPMKAPIKFDLAVKPQQCLPSSTKTSPLKESAIKARAVPFPLQWPGAPSQSPVKERSLLQTPARRLMSPSKNFLSSSKGQHHELNAKGFEQHAVSSLGPEETPFERLEPIHRESSPIVEDMEYDVLADEDQQMSNSTKPDEPPSSPEQRGQAMEHVSLQPVAEFSPQLEDPFVNAGALSPINTPVRPYEITSASSSINSIRNISWVPPPAPSPPVFTAPYPPQFSYRDDLSDGDSDNESMMAVSPSKSPSRRMSIRLVNENDDFDASKQTKADSDFGFTPLVNKLSQWNPDNEERKYPRRRGIFSMAPGDQITARTSRRSSTIRQSRDRLSLIPRSSSVVHEAGELSFDDNTIIHEPEDLDASDVIPNDEGHFTILEDCEENTIASLSANKMDLVEDTPEHLQNCVVDENATPQEHIVTINEAVFAKVQQDEPQPQNPLTVLPMSVTPVRSGPRYPRTVHTVSKVPLKSEDGSLKIPRKRTRSFSAGSNSSPPTSPTATRSKTLPSPRKARSPLKPFIPLQEEHGSPLTHQLPQRPKQPSRSSASSPVKSPRKQPAGHDTILQGAVVYTDVHTKEGADASGIFVELLTQMGARCVKSWNWNPRTSLSPVDGAEPKEIKIGITHVIFKDGGIRTLEKVREANGVVKLFHFIFG